MPFQALVNGWIKVNTKHVVLQREDDNSNNNLHNNSHNGVSSDAAETDANSHHHQKTSLEASNVSADSREQTAIRRFGSRKRNRKLQRTVSHTDILREMAKEDLKQKDVAKDTTKEATKQKNKRNEATSSSSLPVVPPEKQQQKQQTDDVDSENNSLLHVAGFFGTEIAQPKQQQQNRPVYTGKYLNETAFVQQLEQQQHQQQHQQRSGRQLSAEPGGPLKPQSQHEALARSNSTCMTDTDSLSSLRATPPLPSTTASRQSQSSNPMQQFFKIATKRCSSCEELENRLLSTQADNEYLRSVALRNEYICAVCEGVGGSGENIDAAGFSASSTGSLVGASKRLVELNQRHKHQIQNITKDRARWQQDMQMRLAKYASISKDLNEEAAERKLQAADLEDKLQAVTAERDSMATELSQLRAAVQQHEEQQKELERLRALVSNYQLRGLQVANEAIAQRNSVIADLTARLRMAMEAIEAKNWSQTEEKEMVHIR